MKREEPFFQTRYLWLETLLSMLAILTVMGLMSDKKGSDKYIPLIIAGGILILFGMLFQAKLVMYEDRFQILYMLTFWKNEEIFYKDVASVNQKRVVMAKGNKDFYVELKDGRSIKFSPLPISKFEVFELHLQDKLNSLSTT